MTDSSHPGAPPARPGYELVIAFPRRQSSGSVLATTRPCDRPRPSHHLEPTPVAAHRGVVLPVPDSNYAGPGVGSALPGRRPAIDGWENEGGPVYPIEEPRLTKRLIVFDLDGTLAESKAAIDAEMARLLRDLLRIVQVAVISGGDWPQFQRQLVSNLPPDSNLRNLSLLPTCGARFYRHADDWQQLYSDDFTDSEKKRIVSALASVVESFEFETPGTWGELIEDRGSQITFSALGQHAPNEAKKHWDPDFAKRKQIQSRLTARIPEFSVRLGGSTSIDVTRAGIDKGHGIRKLRDILGIVEGEMLFIGDALFPGGNDHAAKEAGVVCIQVRDSHETKRLIETMLACLNVAPRSPLEATSS